MAYRTRRQSAFTLVELLVVIAIIGILVALLLPAVQQAREAARRTQCTNKVRQMGLAVLNLESALKTFPSGGIRPWPRIELYSSGGQPFGPDKQGLSWAFQILPYLEEDAVYDLDTTAEITATPVSLYFCPSRRPPVQSTVTGHWLMDYASLTPGPTRIEIGNDATFERLLDERGCSGAYGYWGTTTNGNQHDPRPKRALGRRYAPFNGIIVRSSYMVSRDDSSVIDLDYTPIVKGRKIKDGLSKTSMISEKWIRLGSQHAAYDDRGWSDGWDLDTVSSTFCQPIPDNAATVVNGAISAGSNHSSGLNVVFADDSVRFVPFEIDLEVWNMMSHRSDGQVYQLQ